MYTRYLIIFKLKKNKFTKSLKTFYFTLREFQIWMFQNYYVVFNCTRELHNETEFILKILKHRKMSTIKFDTHI